MNPVRYTVLLGVYAVVLLGLTGAGAHALWQRQHDTVVWIMLACAAVYCAAAWLAWRNEGRIASTARRPAIIVIIVTAAVARALLVGAPPLSTDVYRYVWDGRVQAEGINPYRYRPADPRLAFLRDRAVYPNINRAGTALTIYPPFAQAIFLAATRVANSVTGMKAAMAAFEIATMGTLLALLRGCGLPATRLIFYAWHPLPLFEFAGSGHIDAAAIALMIGACLAAQRRHSLTAGALLGAATLVKFFPAAIAPALYRRWGWRFPAALLGVVAVGYLPYSAVGSQVLGFLPGYVQDEGLADGSGFFLLSLLQAAGPLPPWSATAYLFAACATLSLLALTVVMRRGPSPLATGAALALLAVLTLWLSPHLPWYFTWTLPFLCFGPSWALIYLSAAAPLLYDSVWSPGSLPLNATLYIPCLLIFVLEWWHGSRKPLELPNDGSLGPRGAG